MTKDRMADMQEMVGMDEDESFESDHHHFEEPLSSDMAEFFDQIEAIRAAIDQINENVDEVKKKQSQILSNPVNDTNTRAELDELMANAKKTASGVRTQLKRIQQRVEEDEEKPLTACTADFRIRKTQHSTMMRKFVDVMTDYNKTQTDFREKCKNRMDRQLKIAGKDVDDEQLEAALESGDLGSVTQGIFMNTEQAKQTLQDIEARHNDILKLETSIKELHDMFMDMAMLVESQGEMIDRIEFNVEHAEEYVSRATGDVRKAGAYQRAARRKKIMMIACGLIAGIVLIGVLGGMFMP